MTIPEYKNFHQNVLVSGLCRNCLYDHYGVNLGVGEFRFSKEMIECPVCRGMHHTIKGLHFNTVLSILLHHASFLEQMKA